MKRTIRLGSLALVLSAALAAPFAAQASPPRQVSELVEIDGSPLRIQVFANGRLQVFHRDYTQGATFGDGASGAFISVGTAIYGPQVPVGPSVTEYTAVSNSGPSGRGTAGDPYRLVASHRLIGSGADLGLVQTVLYVDGENRFTLQWDLTNYGNQDICFRLYHAADLYFADSDRGYGYHDPQSGAVGGFNEGRDWFMVFIPVVPAAHFREASFGTIWQDIAGGQDFNDTIDTNYLDNGAGLQWNVCLGPGQATAVGDVWSFGSSESEAISAVSGGFRAAGPLASELTTYIPTPLDVSLDPAVIGTNLLFAALAMIAFSSASGLLTKTLSENQAGVAGRIRFVGWISDVQKRIGSVFGARLSRPTIIGFAKLIGIVLFYGLVFSLLDRSWRPFSLAGLWLFVSMTVAYGLVGIAADIIQWFAARRWGLPAELNLKPTSVLLAIVSTLASRLFGLVPGLMFGTPEAFEVDPSAVDRKHERWLLYVAAGTLLVIGLGAWIPTIVTALVRSLSLPEFVLAIVGGVESFLLVIFAVTIENGFVQMLPLRGNVGEALRRWNRWAWFAAQGAILFLFFHLLMNPQGSLAASLRGANVRFFILTVVVFVVGVVLLWAYFKGFGARRAGASAVQAPPWSVISEGPEPPDQPEAGAGPEIEEAPWHRGEPL